MHPQPAILLELLYDLDLRGRHEELQVHAPLGLLPWFLVPLAKELWVDAVSVWSVLGLCLSWA